MSDLAAAAVLGVQVLEHGAESDAFNLDNGIGFSVCRVIDAAERVIGRVVPVELGSRRPGDPAALFSLPASSRPQLGWQPRLSAVDGVIRTAWAWQPKHSPRLHSIDTETATA